MEQEPSPEFKQPIKWGCNECEETQYLTDANTVITYFINDPGYSYVEVDCQNECDGMPYFIDDEGLGWLSYITNIEIVEDEVPDHLKEEYLRIYGHDPQFNEPEEVYVPPETPQNQLK